MMETTYPTSSRSGSVSTLVSCHSDEIDTPFDALNLDGSNNHTPIPSSPHVESRVDQLQTQDLGERMTIIAATSPEIKALNLPVSPTFPTQLDFGRSNSFSGRSKDPLSKHPTPTLSRAQSTLERVSLNVETVDEVDDYKAWRGDSMRRSAFDDSLYYENREDDLLTMVDPKPIPRHPDENKENLHPNLMQAQQDKKTLTIKIEGAPSTVKEKSLHKRRTSLHRRVSYESLPSPAEIGPSPNGPDSITPQRSNLTISSNTFTFDLPELEEPPTLYCRPSAPLPSMHVASKTMQLSTGFR